MSRLSVRLHFSMPLVAFYKKLSACGQIKRYLAASNARIMVAFLDKINNSDKLVLLDFWANWCGPCKAMFPVLDALQQEMHPQLEIVKVDVDEYLDLAVSMKIMGVPTFILYKNGVECWREPGTFTKEALKKMIEPFETSCAR